MNLKLFFLIFAIVISFNAHSLELVSLEGSSAVEKTTEGKLVILGGIAGKPCETFASGKTCNNCTGELKACNPSRIYPGLPLRFHLKSNTPNPEVVLRIMEPAAFRAYNVLRLKQVSSKELLSVFEIKWSTLCTAWAESQGKEEASCSSDFKLDVQLEVKNAASNESDPSLPIRIGVVGNKTPDFHYECNETENPYGFCVFSLSESNGKVRLNFLVSQETFPAAPGSIFTHMHLFYDWNSFEKISLSSNRFLIGLNFNGHLNMDPTEFVPGKPGTMYFRGGLEDAAGNLGYFTSPKTMQNENHKVVIP